MEDSTGDDVSVIVGNDASSGEKEGDLVTAVTDALLLLKLLPGRVGIGEDEPAAKEGEKETKASFDEELEEEVTSIASLSEKPSTMGVSIKTFSFTT